MYEEDWVGTTIIESLQEEIADLHELVARIYSLIDPGAYPEIAAQVDRVLGATAADGDCGNPVCMTRHATRHGEGR